MESPTQREGVAPEFPPGKVLLSVRCHQCGYNLKGVEPAGVCPECGAAVWPSLRPYVDSSDERLALLAHPKRTGGALMVVSFGMLLSAVMLWWPYLHALGRQVTSPGGPLISDVSPWHYILVAILAGVAFAATFALRQPTGAASPVEYRQGLVLARYGLLGWAVLHGFLLFHDASAHRSVREWYDLVHLDAARSLLRLGLDACAITMILGFEPVEMFLARRSMPHRMGGASRQGFMAIFVSIIAVACGDLIRLAAWGLDAIGLSGWATDNAALVGTMLVLIGSAMMTIALLNLAIDSSRLARNLARRLHRLGEVVG